MKKYKKKECLTLFRKSQIDDEKGRKQSDASIILTHEFIYR